MVHGEHPSASLLVDSIASVEDVGVRVRSIARVPDVLTCTVLVDSHGKDGDWAFKFWGYDTFGNGIVFWRVTLLHALPQLHQSAGNN